METNLVFEALKFMVLGMGIVFLFLIVMIYALKLQAMIVEKFLPEKEATPIKPLVNNSNETSKMAAIVTAVQHHKNLKG